MVLHIIIDKIVRVYYNYLYPVMMATKRLLNRKHEKMYKHIVLKKPAR